jgi:hypothetical protein
MWQVRRAASMSAISVEDGLGVVEQVQLVPGEGRDAAGDLREACLRLAPGPTSTSPRATAAEVAQPPLVRLVDPRGVAARRLPSLSSPKSR